ncbi:MAG: hypothetical protein WC058_16450 [Phycisphaeraceae bacterium]
MGGRGVAGDGDVDRVSEALGRTLVNKRQAEMWACERGDRPRGQAGDPALRVIEMEGGRVQSREKNTETDSRMHESARAACGTDEAAVETLSLVNWGYTARQWANMCVSLGRRMNQNRPPPPPA